MDLEIIILSEVSQKEKCVIYNMTQMDNYTRLPLARTPESQITAEQSSTGRHWNSPKKIPHNQRHRRNHNETVGGAQTQ